MRRTPLLAESIWPGTPKPREARAPRRRKRKGSPQPVDNSDHYIAVKLGGKSKKRLLDRVGPAHKVVQGDHVTLVAQPTPADVAKFRKMHGQNVSFHATHHAADSGMGIQAVRVHGLDHLSDKEHKHVTISSAPDVPAKRSNDLLSKHDGDRLPDWVRLNGTIEVAKRLGKT